MSKLPATMNAVEIREFGPAEGLVLTERPVPIPNDGEVLVRVSYAGVNRPDVQRVNSCPTSNVVKIYC